MIFYEAGDRNTVQILLDACEQFTGLDTSPIVVSAFGAYVKTLTPKSAATV